MKLNCWEFICCGREPGGVNVDEMGVCGVALEVKCDGVNDGKNAGRICWVVCGTLCGGEVQGSYANKIPTCLECEFYQLVSVEEGQEFEAGANVLPLLNDPLELAKSYETLSRTYRALKSTHAQFIQSEGQLAAGVAHEINNPLTGILAFAEVLLENTDEDDPRRKDYQFIIHETLRCRGIVRDLLNYSRQSKPSRKATNIWPIIQGSLGVVQNDPSFQEIRFRMMMNDCQLRVNVDPAQMQQALLNIIINARDAMGGRGEIVISTREKHNTGELVVEISDEGCGIEPAILHRIFEPFFSTKGESGNGLGLSAVQSIVEENEGAVTFDSSVGMGSIFRILLPSVKG